MIVDALVGTGPQGNSKEGISEILDWLYNQRTGLEVIQWSHRMYHQALTPDTEEMWHDVCVYADITTTLAAQNKREDVSLLLEKKVSGDSANTRS